jgi:hypothetical protein
MVENRSLLLSISESEELRFREIIDIAESVSLDSY